MTPLDINALSWQQLKFFCGQQEVGQGHAPAAEQALIGQPRAARALEFGLQMKEPGYNLYLCGPTGTGRTTFAEKYAQAQAAHDPTPPDLCYVYNFGNPKVPKLLTLPAGTGRRVKDALDDLLARLCAELPKTFNSREHEQKKGDIVKILHNKREDIIKEITEEAAEQQFGVKSSSSGIYFMPIIEGEVISEEQFESLSQEQKDAIAENSEVIGRRAAEVMREIKEHEKVTKKDVDELEYTLGLFTVGRYLNDVIEAYAHIPALLAFLQAVKEDILENLADFVNEEQEEDETMQALVPWMAKRTSEDTLSKYKINLLTDNGPLQGQGAPVVLDYNPTYAHLVGEVEYDNEYGNFSTDFMKIKPGLLHRANGGYLILQAQDLLSSPHAWETLRRALVTRQIITEPLREYTTGVAVSGIKPQPIPLQVKVLLVGGGYFYDVLHAYDDYFSKLFKIRVDFDHEMHLNPDNMGRIVQFVKAYEDGEARLPFSPCATAAVVEYATRLAQRQDRLTTRFNQLQEILAEATSWAHMAPGSEAVMATHVAQAIAQRTFRLNLYEEKLADMLHEDTLLVATTGTCPGQINGLAVLDVGDFAFAIPSRIPATTYMGKSGVVNIEKEADLSGAIHDKGVQVLMGYLGHTYAQDFPLSLSCRICFEQNYSGVDGDSASSTELYAILSSLSGLPIRQDIAVTGSINQHGEVQPIGGATHKVEGWFDLCARRGLTGSQGVLIPARNTRDLVLKDEVIQAVKDGLFHIYPIRHVNEGMALLLGAPAGQPHGGAPLDTVHGRVYRKLRGYHRKAIKGE